MRLILLSILAGLAIGHAAAAEDLDALVGRADSLGLAEHPVWLRLLHFKGVDPESQSEILSDDFFLAPTGRRSAHDELKATLEAYSLEATKVPQPSESVLCRFPARFLFLEKALDIELRDVDCPRLERWIKRDQLDSISLMMISGYFGNPASTFGHILLKVNNGSVPDGYTLLDLGINYGAVVPDNEPTVVYVLRGLFGGYEAGFSDQDYYRADLTYTRTEFRDMWEYKLNLTRYQEELLLYHLWEITGKRFRYFFLKTNCSYRIAELLELVTDESFIEDVDVWYAPISTFHRLHELDREAPPEDDLIASIRYRPSAQRVFYARVNQLEPAEKKRLNRVIQSGGNLDQFAGVPEREKARVLDVLLEYYQYRMAGVLDEETDLNLRQAKDDALRARLALPPIDAVPRVDIPARRAPSSAAPPSKFGIGVGNSAEWDAYSYLTFAPFAYETTGNNLLDRSSLIVGSLSVGVWSDGIDLLELDVIRARKVNLERAMIAGESTSSWEVALGARRATNACRDCREAFAEGAIGRSSRLGDDAALTALFGVDLATGSAGSSGFGRFLLNFGNTERWGSEIDATWKYYFRDGEDRLVLRWTSRLSINHRHELHLDVVDDDVLDARIFYAFRW